MPSASSFRKAMIFAVSIASVTARPAHLVARSSGAAGLSYSSVFVAPTSSQPASYAPPASSASASYAAPANSAPGSYAPPASSAPASYVAPASSGHGSYALPASSALGSYIAPASSAPASCAPQSISLPGSVTPTSVSLPGSVAPPSISLPGPIASTSSAPGSYTGLPSLSNGLGIVVPSAAPSTTSPTTTPIEVTPTPGPIWHIDLEVGKTAFDIGNADPTTFEGLWKNTCGVNGCDGGSPQPFDFTGVGGGVEVKLTGSFTMSGSVDNNQVWTTDLLDAINGALQGSKQCTTSQAESCPLKRDPDTPGVASDCSWGPFTTCTMANYIQATLYDDTHSQKAQITMSASSQSADFDCETVLGTMNGIATGLDLAPPVIGATILAQVVCDAVSGS